MEDYEIDYEQSCPKCEFNQSYYRQCDQFDCNGGMIDQHFDDPISYPVEGKDLYTCPECEGTNKREWCPKCGYEY